MNQTLVSDEHKGHISSSRCLKTCLPTNVSNHEEIYSQTGLEKESGTDHEKNAVNSTLEIKSVTS